MWRNNMLEDLEALIEKWANRDDLLTNDLFVLGVLHTLCAVLISGNMSYSDQLSSNCEKLCLRIRSENLPDDNNFPTTEFFLN